MKTVRTVVLFAGGWVVFALAVAASAIPPLDAHPILSQVTLKTLLVLFVLAAVLLDRRRTWADYGFRGAARPVPWWAVIGVGLLLGGAATTMVLLTPAKGMTFLRQFGFVGMVLVIWLYSSLTEEIFVRGWFQTVADAGQKVKLLSWTLSGAVLASALFFGSMHLTLLLKGGDVLTAVIIVSATTLLGLAAAIFRERYQGLLPAFVTHVAFNVGGMAAGIAVNIIALATTGKIIHK